MKQTTALLLLCSIALGSITAGIFGTIHHMRKIRKHQPAATFRELYEDNADPELDLLYY